MDNMKTSTFFLPMMISEECALTGAHGNLGFEIPVWDECFGNLYISRDSMGILGIVRADSWEKAYKCCEDEFFPRASLEDQSEFEKEFGATWYDDPCWQEQYGFSGNNGIYVKDLNGDSLKVLTLELATKLGITLISQQYS